MLKLNLVAQGESVATNQKEDTMKKYTLFSEFNFKKIYGEDLSDAVLHCGTLNLQSRFDGKAIVNGKQLIIKKVLCYENVEGIKRGYDRFERVVVELDDGKRIAIDACPAPPGTLST